MVRVVLLTTGSSHAVRIFESLAARDIRVDSTLLLLRTRRGDWQDLLRAIRHRQLVRVGRAVGRRAARLLLRRSRREEWQDPRFYRQYGDSVVVIHNLDQEGARHLGSEKADLLVLAGCPIVPAAILAIPTVGTLNAHPGLLPGYRGLDVVAWAVLNGDDVGATVHWVDAGVDTGMICARRRVPTFPGDTLESLRARAEGTCGDLMADVVNTLVRGESIEALPNPMDGGRRYQRMDRRTLKRAQAALRTRHLG